MNYTNNTLTWLIQLAGSVITWLFNTELVSVNNVSISFGSAFVYFFIVYLVISLFLGARFSGLGSEISHKSRDQRAAQRAQANHDYMKAMEYKWEINRNKD